MISRILIVKGKVQGVFFRRETKKMATILGICGVVKNEENGDVYIEAEGDSAMVFRLIDYCHHGPEGASVKNVSILLGEVKNYSTFEIIS